MDSAGEELFNIGAVSRMTGIPVHTLRAWERRYGAVSPKREAGGGRIYGRDDLTRLRLIKRLTEAGHSVGTVAQLPLESLRERANEMAPEPATPAQQGPRRAAVLGGLLPARLREDVDEVADLEIVAATEDQAAFAQVARAAAADTLVLELPTVHRETAAEVLDLLQASGARQAVVVYAFGPRDAAAALDTSRIRLLRAPVTAAEVARAWRSGPAYAPPADGSLVDWALEQPVREHRYDDATLAGLASLSPTMACECPNHMADLVASLAAFERYSSECESRSREDAELHYTLNAVTAQARALMEDALAHLVAAEGIDDNGGQ